MYTDDAEEVEALLRPLAEKPKQQITEWQLQDQILISNKAKRKRQCKVGTHGYQNGPED